MPVGFNTPTDTIMTGDNTDAAGKVTGDGTGPVAAIDSSAGAVTNDRDFPAVAVGGALYGTHVFVGATTRRAEVAVTGADVSGGSAEAAVALLELKENVDTMSVTAGALFNQVSNVMSHLGSLNAGYALDVASKMDVDFAGETTELAKGQILAQAGTAMLAQANAQGQGMLALIQS